MIPGSVLVYKDREIIILLFYMKTFLLIYKRIAWRYKIVGPSQPTVSIHRPANVWFDMIISSVAGGCHSKQERKTVWKEIWWCYFIYDAVFPRSLFFKNLIEFQHVLNLCFFNWNIVRAIHSRYNDGTKLLKIYFVITTINNFLNYI